MTIKFNNSNINQFDLLPSFFDLKQKIDWFKLNDYNLQKLLNNIKCLIALLKKQYQFILIDTQAGEGSIGVYSTLLSNNVIVVSEHGKVPNEALETLISQIRNKEIISESEKYSFFGSTPIKAYNRLIEKDYSSLKQAIKSNEKPLEKIFNILRL